MVMGALERLTPPRALGEMVLFAKLGQGGMASVYLAVDGHAGFERVAAVKMLRTDAPGDDYKTRFLDEARVVTRLQHNNLVSVRSAGEIGGQLFIAMEAIAGRDLSDVWDRCAEVGRAFPVPLAVHLIREVLRGLHYAHTFPGLSLVHRDVSPSNVLIDWEGAVRLADFGLATSTLKGSLTMPGVVFGKVGYMSPEQALRGPLDRRTDIYACGAILWELLTGRPLRSTDELETDRVARFQAVPPSEYSRRVDDELDRIVARALSHDKERRWDSAEAMLSALTRWLAKHAPETSQEEVASFLQLLFGDARSREHTERESMVNEVIELCRDRPVERDGRPVSSAAATQASEVAGRRPSESGTRSGSSGVAPGIVPHTPTPAQGIADTRVLRVSGTLGESPESSAHTVPAAAVSDAANGTGDDELRTTPAVQAGPPAGGLAVPSVNVSAVGQADPAGATPRVAKSAKARRSTGPGARPPSGGKSQPPPPPPPRNAGATPLPSESPLADAGLGLRAADFPAVPSVADRALSEFISEGTVIAERYCVKQKIGQGGMGTVYFGEHVTVGRSVAIKVLTHEWSSNRAVAERFRTEARAASAAGHGNIVEVFDAGTLPDGRLFLVMEFLVGRNLFEELRQAGPMSVERACRVVRGITRAIRAAHGVGVIHRDLKPDNVMLVQRGADEGEDVKVLDFGISATNDQVSRGRLTMPGRALGTPEYMAPEQGRGQAPTHRLDIYSLGVIFFELLVGTPPFTGTNFVDIMARKASERAPSIAQCRADLPRDLVTLIDSCLSRRPESRPASADAVLAVVDAVLARCSPADRVDPSPSRVNPPPSVTMNGAITQHDEAVPQADDESGGWTPARSRGRARRWMAFSAAVGSVLAALWFTGEAKYVVEAGQHIWQRASERWRSGPEAVQLDGSPRVDRVPEAMKATLSETADKKAQKPDLARAEAGDDDANSSGKRPKAVEGAVVESKKNPRPPHKSKLTISKPRATAKGRDSAGPGSSRDSAIRRSSEAPRSTSKKELDKLVIEAARNATQKKCDELTKEQRRQIDGMKWQLVLKLQREMVELDCWRPGQALERDRIWVRAYRELKNWPQCVAYAARHHKLKNDHRLCTKRMGNP